jgi:Zn-dependent peptidase ImmA (M78 family)
MRKADPYNFAAAAAERVIREQGITSLPVDPIAIARSLGIDVQAKPSSNAGVSGMLIRLNDQFCIAYATHIKSLGFRRFSVAHELGHYFLEGHVNAIFADGSVHESHAGFLSTMKYELEADHFAARLLMPNTLFYAALRGVADGLAAVESLADTCCASLTATAIRYTECTPDPTAIVISSGNKVDYAAMSRSLRDIDGIDGIRRNQPLPRDCVTLTLNSDPERVRRSDRVEGESAVQDWFGGDLRIKFSEDAIGLGGYGKTLTVLYGIELPEEDDNDKDIVESWTPRHRR